MSAGPVDGALDVFKDMVFDQLVKLAISHIIGLAPFLSFGPVAFVISRVVVYIANLLYGVMKDAINFQVILLNNSIHHKAFISAQIQLRQLAKEKGIESPEFKKSREDHAKHLSTFIRYSGT